MTWAAYAAPWLVLAGCAAYAATFRHWHPLWRARYWTARLLHPVPGLPDDGGPLTGDEWLELDRIASVP